MIDKKQRSDESGAASVRLRCSKKKIDLFYDYA